MPESLISEEADIHQCPVVDIAHKADVGDEITSGDVHGNAMKLLFLLTKYGIAKNMTEEVYQQFVGLYQKSFETEGLSNEDLVAFDGLLGAINFESEATLRWLGDMLADRGGNDFLTLLILQRLRACGIKFEIILSNHDFEFIVNYENAESNFSKTRLLQWGPTCNSMTRLSKLLEAGIVKRQAIDAIMSTAYLPALKLLSYTVSDDGKTITLFSHAPIGLPNIAYLAKLFKVPYDESSLAGLTNTIDKINQSFIKNAVNPGRIAYFVEGTWEVNPSRDPIGYALWNRDAASLSRPAEINGYRVKYAHGHDSNEADKLPAHIINLDNNLGKAYPSNNQWVYANQGMHTVLCSQWNQGLQESNSQRLEAASHLALRRSSIDLGLWLMVDFPGIIMALDKQREGAKHEFLNQVRDLGMTAENILHLEKNYQAASSLAEMCEDLIHGFEKYSEDRDEVEFKQVCLSLFAKIKTQMDTPVFAKRGVIFAALAKGIEEMHVGLWAKDLYVQPPETVSDKQASLFSKASDSQVSEDLDSDIASIPASKPGDPNV